MFIMKQITAVVVGAGNRGFIYATYASNHKDEFNVVGVVDPNAVHASDMAKLYDIPASGIFYSVDDFVKSGFKCDLVINATIDSLHYEISKKLMTAGYNVLMEKPITAKKEELLSLRDIAKVKGVNLFVCHVLRYTPYYRNIKQNILDGKIGKITAIEMAEHVCNMHYIESYVVGKWRSEKECGSTFMLAKSCHDTDLMCWFNNVTEPEEVAKFLFPKTLPKVTPKPATPARMSLRANIPRIRYFSGASFSAKELCSISANRKAK